MLTLLDCMVLAAFLVAPFAGMLYMMFISLFDIVADWFKGDGESVRP